MENLHAGVYKLRLRNESGVFECIANVDIDNPERKEREKEKQRKKEEEEKKQREEEERRQKEEEERLNYVNKNLSDLKVDGKDEDKDSGLKIGEESANGSEYEYEYEYSDDYEDYYEDEECDKVGTQNNNIEQTEDNLETSNILFTMENTSNENQEEVHPKEEPLENSFVSEENANYYENQRQICDNMDNLDNNNGLNTNEINNEKSNFITNMEINSYEKNEDGQLNEDFPDNSLESEEKPSAKDHIESCASNIQKEILDEDEYEENEEAIERISSELSPQEVQ